MPLLRAIYPLLPPPPHFLPSLQIFHRHAALLAQAKARCSALEESFLLQQFLGDVREVERWVQERMKVAVDDTFKDPSNLEAKLKQQQSFESELQANKGRVEAVMETESKLAASNHFAMDTIRCVCL